MHTPEEKTFYVMDMIDHSAYQKNQGPSLDSIATRVYGRRYVGQQTGDMIANDSHHVYVMDENSVDDWNYDMSLIPGEDGEFRPKRHYIGYDRATMEGIYAEGVNWFDYWLGLDLETAKYDFEVYRQAPEPHYVLADLIRRGELPHGTYLLHVSW